MVITLDTALSLLHLAQWFTVYSCRLSILRGFSFPYTMYFPPQGNDHQRYFMRNFCPGLFFVIIVMHTMVQGEALLAMPAWALIEYDLAKSMYQGLKRFWASVRHKAAAGQDFLMPPPEVMPKLIRYHTIRSFVLSHMRFVTRGEKCCALQIF